MLLIVEESCDTAVTNNTTSVTKPVTILGAQAHPAPRGRDRIGFRHEPYAQPSEGPWKIRMTAEFNLKKDSTPKRESGTVRAHITKLNGPSFTSRGSLDLDTVLQEVAYGARSLTAARYDAVTLFSDCCKEQQFVTSGVSPEECQLLEDLSCQLGENLCRA